MLLVNPLQKESIKDLIGETATILARYGTGENSDLALVRLDYALRRRKEKRLDVLPEKFEPRYPRPAQFYDSPRFGGFKVGIYADAHNLLLQGADGMPLSKFEREFYALMGSLVSEYKKSATARTARDSIDPV